MYINAKNNAGGYIPGNRGVYREQNGTEIKYVQGEL